MNKLTIVMYHHVREIKNSKYPKIKGLEFVGFKRQLDYLENNYKIIEAQRLLDFASGGKDLPKNSCLLTFDDGYKDHIEYVLPELLKRKIQGSFFPSAGPAVEQNILDSDYIHFILACCPNYKELISLLNQLCLDNGITNQELKNNWIKYGIATRFDTKEVRYVKGMLQHLLPRERRNKIIKKIFKKYIGIKTEKFSKELYMSFGDTKKLIHNGMYVGGHGYNHLWMNEENRKSQETEIELTLEFLKNVGAPIKKWIMCYPFGAYNSETLSLLKEKNCSAGLTIKIGANNLAKDNLFKLKRFDTNDFPKY